MQATAQKENTLLIDRNAPLTVRKEIFIAVSPEAVWQLHTDINRWAVWRSDIASAVLECELQPGSVFVWKTPGVKITSTLQEVETNRRIGWTGVGVGTKATHVWTLEPRDGGTLVITEESMSGWLPRVMKLVMPKFLNNSLGVWLGDLKKQLEHEYAIDLRGNDERRSIPK
jgi:uncharacterized protein YndB with AHSA1/START domain